MQKLACSSCLLALWLTGVVYAQNGSCAKLAQVALPQAAIVSSSIVPAGSFSPPAGSASFTNMPRLYRAVPEFCRVVIAGHPSADSDIRIEVWMPAVGWNGKLQGQGNGGFAGGINYPGLAVYVSRGYASVSTDTGHSSAGELPDASWALGHPQKVVDFGYRAIHQMTELARTIVAAFYGTKPRYSYFASCSNGGRQALMEAQRYPEDYDGILAGAPANYWTHLLTNALWNAQSTTADAASYIPSSKLPAIAAAVNAACDAQDGVKDGVLNDPRQCRFDPAAMLCKNGDSDQCLTQPQTVALRKLYEGAHDAGGQIFPGYLPGAEAGPGGWEPWITGQGPGHAAIFYFAQGFFGDMVYEKADWNYKTADLSQAVRNADLKQAQNLNATDPNLERFRSHGGKLILYHGWNDPAISALNTVNYYNAVLRQMGQANSESFLRLYMVPGMQHCGGGPAATEFGENGASQAQDPEHNIRVALETWVEKGTAPSKIVASKYADGQPPQQEMPKVEMTRPLCPYPQSAKFKGSGDPSREENFVCRAPQP